VEDAIRPNHQPIGIDRIAADLDRLGINQAGKLPGVHESSHVTEKLIIGLVEFGEIHHVVLHELASLRGGSYSRRIRIDAGTGIEPSTFHKQIDESEEILHASGIA